MAQQEELTTLERIFADAGIDTTKPGFCESPAFLAAEAADPTLLTKYGHYVRARAYDAAYADFVRGRVGQLVPFLASELARDGRLGACIDASAVAMRFLERQGIWGYGAQGSLVVDFVNPLGRHVAIHHFMHPQNPAQAGHAWLCVPPFDIVDLTIQAQSGFTEAERKRLAPVFVESAFRQSTVTVEELAEPELRALFHQEMGRRPRVDDFVSRELRDYWKRSPAKVVTVPGARLKYIECGVLGGDGAALDDMRNLILSGKHPGELYEAFVNSLSAGNS